MVCLKFQSLKGIKAVRRRSKQLTPLSPDVFVSIPERDSSNLHRYCDRVSLRPLPKLSHSVGH